MTVQIIPTYDTPFWTQTTTLEGQTFQLEFAFNHREGCWYVSIADSAGVDIYNGCKLLCLQLLLRKCRDPRRPAGEFFVFDATGSNTPPGLSDLLPSVGRCTLVYLTSDILAQASTAEGLAAVLASLDAGNSATPQSTYGQQ